MEACAIPGQGIEVPGANATSTQAVTTTQPNPPTNQETTSSPTAPMTQTQTQATATRTTAPTSPVITQNPASLGLTKIELYLQPSPATVGDTVRFYVKGYKADGSTFDVTNRATFTMSGSLGSLSETSFVAAKAGSGAFTATVADNGQSFSASAPLTVNQPVTLSRLTIQPTNISLKPGQSQPLTVTAYYSSGFTKDVTSSVTWSLSNPLAAMAGSNIVAGNSAGGVTVMATYSDAGSKVTSDAYFQIVATAVTGLQ